MKNTCQVICSWRQRFKLEKVRAVMLKDRRQEDHLEGVLDYSWLSPMMCIPNKSPGKLLWLLREDTLRTTGLQ